jgi:hypothetical protein
MKFATNNILGLCLGAAALCVTALPAAAASFTQPGGTMGAPAGANPPPGLYFANALNYGIGRGLPGASFDDSTAVGVEVPIFIWVPGWNFLGATYAAAVAAPLVDVGIRSPGHLADTYLRGVFNPDVNPITLSWNLGNGFFVSFGEHIYIPINSEVVVASSAAGVVSSAASFEQRVAVSYIANDWVLSANGIFGIVTNDGVGIKGPDYANVDWTIAHNFGKWQIGAVGYGAWDLETTPINFAVGKAAAVAVGGLVGYNFGVVNLQLMATHQVVTHGDTNYGREDTRVWSTLVIPIWNPPAPTPQPLVAKY